MLAPSVPVLAVVLPFHCLHTSLQTCNICGLPDPGPAPYDADAPRQRTMQILAPLVPTVAVVLPEATLMLSPLRFTRRESRRSWPSSSVLKL